LLGPTPADVRKRSDPNWTRHKQLYASAGNAVPFRPTMAKDGYRRTIRDDDYERYARDRRDALRKMDFEGAWTSGLNVLEPDRFEPVDELRFPVHGGNGGGPRSSNNNNNNNSTTSCYRPFRWSYRIRPNCNAVHELFAFDRASLEATDGWTYRFLGQGTFRQAWRLLRSRRTNTTTEGAQQGGLIEQDEEVSNGVVMKTNRYCADCEFDSYSLSQSQTEAMVLDETAASPYTMRLYSYCSTTLVVERGYPLESQHRPVAYSNNFVEQEWVDEQQQHMLQRHQQQQHQQHQEERKRNAVERIVPLNSLSYTVEEKLQIAVQMAESLAVLHGHRNGVIANHDVRFDQWLWDADLRRLKLNDFNKVRVLPWDVRNQRYCRFYSSQGGMFRAPEEVDPRGKLTTNESADVVAFGRLLYVLVTGLIPYYHKKSEQDAEKAILAGEPPFVDIRYRYNPGGAAAPEDGPQGRERYVTARLIELMERAYAHKEQDRVDIFYAVQHLRETARRAGVPLL